MEKTTEPEVVSAAASDHARTDSLQQHDEKLASTSSEAATKTDEPQGFFARTNARIQGVKYIDKDWNVFDGGHVPYNCTDINRQQYSYNAAILLSGAAYMYDYVRLSLIIYTSREWGR